MEIRKTATSTVHADDLLTIGITHEIKVGRETSWVKYEVAHRVRPEETQTIESDLIEHVNNRVMDAVHTTVERIRSEP